MSLSVPFGRGGPCVSSSTVVLPMRAMRFYTDPHSFWIPGRAALPGSLLAGGVSAAVLAITGPELSSSTSVPEWLLSHPQAQNKENNEAEHRPK